MTKNLGKINMRRNGVYFLLLFFFLSGLVICESEPLRKGYFPKNFFDSSDELNQMIVDWYSGQISAMDEPSYYELSNDRAIHQYRFLYLRTFHNPISISIDINSDKTAELRFKRLNGKGGYDPGTFVDNSRREMTKEEVFKFLVTLDSTYNFWKIDVIRTDMVEDGARWIFEGVKKGQYHIIDYQSPKSGPVYELGLYFIALSGKEVEPIY